MPSEFEVICLGIRSLVEGYGIDKIFKVKNCSKLGAFVD